MKSQKPWLPFGILRNKSLFSWTLTLWTFCSTGWTFSWAICRHRWKFTDNSRLMGFRNFFLTFKKVFMEKSNKQPQPCRGNFSECLGAKVHVVLLKCQECSLLLPCSLVFIPSVRSAWPFAWQVVFVPLQSDHGAVSWVPDREKGLKYGKGGKGWEGQNFTFVAVEKVSE